MTKETFTIIEVAGTQVRLYMHASVLMDGQEHAPWEGLTTCREDVSSGCLTLTSPDTVCEHRCIEEISSMAAGGGP